MPSGSRTRICWNCEEEADHFEITCPRKAKQGSGTAYNRSTDNSPNRGASQDGHKANMIKSGYGTNMDGEDEEESTERVKVQKRPITCKEEEQMDAMLEHEKQKATNREDEAILAFYKLDKEEAIKTLERLTAGGQNNTGTGAAK